MDLTDEDLWNLDHLVTAEESDAFADALRPNWREGMTRWTTDDFDKLPSFIRKIGSKDKLLRMFFDENGIVLAHYQIMFERINDDKREKKQQVCLW